MIRMSDNRIGLREFTTVIFFILVTKVADGTPTMMFSKGQTATWLLPIITAVPILISFCFLSSVLKKFRNQDLLSIIFTVLGRFWGCLLGTAIVLFTIAGLLVNIRDYTQIIKTLNYPLTPETIISASIIGSSSFLAYRGVEVIGRTSWIIYPYMHAALLLLIFIISFQLVPGFLFPLGGPGAAELLRTSVTTSTLYAEVILIAILYPSVRSHEAFRNGILYGVLLSAAQISVMLLVYLTLFGYPVVANISYPFQELGMTVQIGGRVVNSQSFYLLFWIMSAIVRYSIYIYAAAAYLRRLLNVQETGALVVALGGLSWMLSSLPENGLIALLIRERGLIQYSWPFFLFFPFLLWLLARRKEKRRKPA